MGGQTNDPYERLLREWQAKREVVNVYHSALRFLTPALNTAPERQRALQRELNNKLASALGALRQESDRLHRYEEQRTTASSR